MRTVLGTALAGAALVGTLAAGPMAEAQTAPFVRMEIHPVQSMTLSGEQRQEREAGHARR